jgi:hypothetical protein
LPFQEDKSSNRKKGNKMKKQTAITWLALMSVTGLVGMNAALAAPFYDNFDRSNSLIVGNGWSQGTSNSVKMQPQIESNQAAFHGDFGNNADGYSFASITHTFDAAPDVSVSLSWDRATSQTGEFMTFKLNGTTGILDIWEKQFESAGAYIPIQITYLSTTYWANIPNVTTPNFTYNDYEVISSGGSTRLYVNGDLKWTSPDAGIGPMTSASVGAVNNYWKWHQFFADDFAAVPEPASLALLGLGALGLLRRRR